MNRCRFLFVDDEPRILEGIARMLRPLRDRIEVLTAAGGEDALRLLGVETVDAVISDMRMPGMDGAQLLIEVRIRHPSLARIILSGQSDRDTIVRATGAAHQFLSKPCSAEDLRATIDRCIGLAALLPDPRLRGLVSAIDCLPSAPGTLEALRQEMASATTPDGAARIIAGDPGLSGKVAQVTATSFFGMPRGILPPFEAARHLGSDVLRALDQAGRLSLPGSEAFPWQAWAGHATRVSALARRFALKTAPEQANAAELAGMLHCCGRMALAVVLGDPYAPLTTTSAEVSALGCSHDQVGAFLLGLWGLPTQVVQSVAWHHGRLGTAPSVLDAILHVADALDDDEAIDHPALAAAGLASDVETWCRLAGEQPR